MGFSISGIAINRNIKKELSSFFAFNGFNIDANEDEEIDFLDAMDSFKGDGIVDIYFSIKSTIIFVDQKISLRPYFIEKGKVLTFDYHENSMAFYMDYCENDKLIRRAVEIDGEYNEQIGEPLDCEIEYDDLSGAIPEMIESLTGVDIFGTDEEICQRYFIKAI